MGETRTAASVARLVRCFVCAYVEYITYASAEYEVPMYASRSFECREATYLREHQSDAKG